MTGDDLAEASDREYPLLGLVSKYGAADLPSLAVAVLAKTVATFVSFADVFVIGLAFDAMFTDRPLELPLLPTAWVPTDDVSLLVTATGVLVLLKAVDVVFGVLGEYGAGLFANRFVHELRVDAFEVALGIDREVYDEYSTGDVMSALNSDVNVLETFLRENTGLLVWIVMTLVSSFVYMALLVWQLAVIVLLAGPVIAVVNYRFSRLVEARQDRVRSVLADLNARMETTLGGVEVVKTFNAEADESAALETASRDHFLARWRNQRVAAGQAPANRFITGTWLVLVTAVSVYWALAGTDGPLGGTVSVGALVPFLFYLQRLTSPMSEIGYFVEQYKRAKAAAKRVRGLTELNRPRDCEDAVPLSVEEGRVQFRDVRFGYAGEDRNAVDGVTLRANSGDTIGIVGSTGAGKSTLLKLLLRFYDPDGGRIEVDGQDVRSVTRASLREQIGYVNQDPFVFSGTVRENITHGGRDLDAAAVERASREAGAHEFITQLEDGYETVIGEGGVDLSGGQRQRLVIARAFVSDPPILVFDEATSHVDNATEALIQSQLARLTDDRTTFVVAHRLSTVRNADEIVVLDDGRIVERGDHRTLLEADGTYATLWRIQVGELDDADTP